MPEDKVNPHGPCAPGQGAADRGDDLHAEMARMMGRYGCCGGMMSRMAGTAEPPAEAPAPDEPAPQSRD